jgi:hypothetical protein
MTHLDRIVRDILHDPWTSRIFLAFTVGMFLSCSAEFAAGQESPALADQRASVAAPPIADAVPLNGQAR